MKSKIQKGFTIRRWRSLRFTGSKKNITKITNKMFYFYFLSMEKAIAPIASPLVICFHSCPLIKTRKAEHYCEPESTQFNGTRYH